MENTGEQFIHQKNPTLHTSPEIEKATKRAEMREEKISQKPADKIEIYLNRFKDILNPPPLEKHPDFDRQHRNINMLKNSLYENVIIKPADIPESYFENQIKLAREQGHGNIRITQEMKKLASENIINDQKSTLNNWVDYLTSPDSNVYPMWAKYWIFSNMLKISTFNKEKHVFAKRDKNTIAPFPDLNREALAYVVDIVIKKAKGESISVARDNPDLKKLIEGTNFGKLYAYAIEKVTPTEKNELLNTTGEWIKYPQGSDHLSLVKSLEGHGTGWCTAGESTAEIQLKAGDFYVYYSYDKDGKPNIPRAAIRMEGEKLAEARGIAEHQHLDSSIEDVVDKKLAEFPDGEKYKKRVSDMKRLTEIGKKHNNKENLTNEDLKFLYQIDSKIEGFGWNEDPRIKEIISKLRPKEKLRMFRMNMSFLLGVLRMMAKEELMGAKKELMGAKKNLKNLWMEAKMEAEKESTPK